MRDIEVINRFKAMASWQDESEVVGVGNGLALLTPHQLLLPMRWDEIDYSLLSQARELYSCPVSILAWGGPSERAAISVYRNAIANGFDAVFVDARARIAWARYVARVLDGVDWSRAFEAVQLNGSMAGVVHEWN